MYRGRSAGLWWLRATSNLRARWLGLIFGDQAMFIRRSTFDELGGFPDLPLMEDLELSLMLRGRGRGRVVVLGATLTASARRLLELLTGTDTADDSGTRTETATGPGIDAEQPVQPV